jgi:hypothetical protein
LLPAFHNGILCPNLFAPGMGAIPEKWSEINDFVLAQVRPIHGSFRPGVKMPG